ncbi:MAG TPA: ABC transporter permease [Terracidiphilus sp.]|jgi:predicted permease
MGWLGRLFSRRRLYNELSETIREHIDEKIADLIDSGMTREKAERAARREFGNVTLIEERSREVWQWPKLENTFADIRFAFRRFHKTPGFALAVIVVLALGITASVSIFAFVNAALLKPLPYRDPASLVAVFEQTATCRECGLSYPDYQDWSRNNSVFRAFDVWAPHAYVWRNPAGAQALRVGQVSGGFFETLGVSPLLGRLFTPSDDTPAAPRTVVLPYGTWQHFFGGRANVLGESLTLNNDAYIVIGVLPREFEFAPRAAELWVTIHDPGPCEQDRACRPFSAVARLNEGISIGAALASTRTIAAQLEKQYPQSNLGQDAFVEPFRDSIIGDDRPILLILLSGAVLLLLIASLNVAGLFLVRSESRRHEMAVRGALGASRARLAYQLLVEAALLVALSVAAGLPAAYSVVRLLAVQIPERVLRGMPYFQSINFDHRVFIFVAAVLLLAVTVCTSASVSRLCFDDLHTGLANGARSSSAIWRRFGSHLIVVELALAIVLLAAAGLLGKSFYRITHVDLNFNPDHIATLEIDANTGYDTPARQLALLRSLLATVNTVPGVKSAATVTSLPVTCNCDVAPYRVLGHAWSGTQQSALSRTVSAAYFATLETRLLSGRSFNEADNGEHPHVALINRTMAQQFFPGEDPVGRIVGDTTLSPASLHQVVGVVDDVREGGLDEPLRPAVYFPANQNPSNYFFLVARTTLDPAVAMPALATAVHRLDPSLGVRNEFTMVGHIHYGAASYLHSSSAWFTGGFAACALLLGVIGLYGVIAYSVSQRTREIGVRMALGAQRAAICRLVLRKAAWLVLLGLVLGIAASFFTGRLLGSLLFGVRPWDLSILIGVSATLAVASFVAAWIPARRAAATDPIEALRNE